ncbi:MAG: hypothetical protein CR974_04125 [Gammaproteobacteria bacterium]|nr:MAG: hypothetical protein CR974_04125 [Gammaproteobacteria bacterium]
MQESAQANNSELPFRLTALESSQDDGGDLLFDFNAGADAGESPVTSHTLPFALGVLESSQSNNDQLPFGLGGDDSGGGNSELPTIIGNCLFGRTVTPRILANCQQSKSKPAPVYRCGDFDYGVTITVSDCQLGVTDRLPQIASCRNGDSAETVAIVDCHSGFSVAVGRLFNCSDGDSLTADLLINCYAQDLVIPGRLKNCQGDKTKPVWQLENCLISADMAVLLLDCYSALSVPTVPVPCEWYDIELPPIDPPYQPPCGDPPGSHKLPFALARREDHHPDNDLLPFVFVCHYQPETTRRKTYMIYNTVTAEIDGLPLGIYSAKLSTNMDAFCWQFDVEIRHDDFDKLQLETRTDEPIIALSINGHRWDMLVENYGERKAFNRDSYTLTGRSKTALLTGDYAKRSTAIVSSAMNASQLAQDQLADLPFTLVYDSDADWFVPGNTYTVNGTPIESIMDIAEAGGHYVESHPTDAQLIIKKRWPVPAWEVSAATARSISPLTWLELQADRKVSTRYNSVRLVGEGDNAKGGYIYRSINAGDPLPEAGTVTHSLYAGNGANTPIAAFRNKGIQILSDSGKHKPYTVKQLWADDTVNPENIKLFEMGEIVEIQDVGGSLGKGVVTGVSIDVGENNGATFITQSANINSYLGD